MLIRLFYTLRDSALADLRGACRAHATPYRTQLFRFRIHFHQKVPVSEVHAPPNGCMPPYGKSWIRHCSESKYLVIIVSTRIQYPCYAQFWHQNVPNFSRQNQLPTSGWGKNQEECLFTLTF